MDLRRVLNVVGLLQVFVALSMGLSGLVSLVYLDGDTGGIFLAAALTLLLGLVTFRLTRFKGDISSREGFAIVTLAWTAAGVFGALPFLFTGTVRDFVPAAFESMSGFTTTGATVFTDIEALPHGILFWRSFTHWLGGMGIIVLAIAILPYLGVGGMQLFKAEVPGPTPERLRPRITQTAKLLWFVYLGLTVAEIAPPDAGWDGPVRRLHPHLRHVGHRRVLHQERLNRGLRLAATSTMSSSSSCTWRG